MNKLYLISENAILEEVTEKQCVVYHCDSGRFYELNEEATFILKNFRTKCTADDILNRIKEIVETESFDEQQTQLVIKRFIQKCIDIKLLKEVNI